MCAEEFLQDKKQWGIFDPLAQFKHRCAKCRYVRVKQDEQVCSICSDLEALPDKIKQEGSEP